MIELIKPILEFLKTCSDEVPLSQHFIFKSMIIDNPDSSSYVNLTYHWAGLDFYIIYV